MVNGTDTGATVWGGTSTHLAEKISRDCYNTLKKVFGHSDYKGKQREIVEAAVQGADVFVLAPTGMGKSLCYQVPAVCQKTGVTLVVSPLLALMKNQVEGLRRKGIPAVSLSSETSHIDKKEIIADMKSSHPRYRLLYMTPERLKNNDFLNILVRMKETDNLNRLVVDEACGIIDRSSGGVFMFSSQAHCISEWGHDFRADYRLLGQFRKMFPDVPIMALTATATPRQAISSLLCVQADIIRSLRIDQDRLFRADHPFNRKNLFYEARPYRLRLNDVHSSHESSKQVRYQSSPEPVSQMTDVADFITALHRRRGEPSCGVVYCKKKATCNDLSEFLRRKGIHARPYHRDIKAQELDKTLQDWTNGCGVDVVVATIAFGLGIDKGDVRYIVHYDLPKSFEGYYQETGRAGRDGLPAKCVLYYSRQDARDTSRLVSNTHEQRMVADGPPPSQRSLSSLASLIEALESTTVCRHVAICRYFGEKIDAQDPEVLAEYCDKMCDICKNPEKTKRRAEKLTGQGFEEEFQSRNSGWRTSIREGDDSSSPAPQLPAFTRPKDGCGSLGMTKRTRSGPTTDESAVKKPKYEPLAPAMVTKAHTSARSLSKPFRPPLMKTTSPTNVSVGQVPSPVRRNKKASPPPPKPAPPAPAEVEAVDGDDIVEDAGPVSAKLPEESDEALESEPSTRPGSTVPEEEPRHVHSTTVSSRSVPDIDYELEATYSEKIPLDVRLHAFNDIRRGLYGLFIPTPSAISEFWGRLGTAQLSKEKKASVLNKAASTLEFTTFSHSMSERFYLRQIAQTVRTVQKELKKHLLQGSGSSNYAQDDEDVTEVGDALRAAYEAVS